MPDIYCTIVLAGELGERFDGVFDGLSLTFGSGRTELTGRVIDQAALNGVLRQVMDLGLEILAITTHAGERGPGPERSTEGTGPVQDPVQDRPGRPVQQILVMSEPFGGPRT